MSKRTYQPSNGTEGMAFMEAYCFRCQHDAKYRRTDDGRDGCKILCRTMLYSPSDGIGPDKYPTEWVRDDDGAECTAFKPEWNEKRDGPQPVDADPRTLPLFEETK